MPRWTDRYQVGQRVEVRLYSGDGRTSWFLGRVTSKGRAGRPTVIDDMGGAWAIDRASNIRPALTVRRPGDEIIRTAADCEASVELGRRQRERESR